MKKILTIILIITLLFSFGCVTQTKDGEKSSGKTFTFTGKNGIIIDFEEDSPPETNFVNEPIEVVIKLTNRGAKELGSGEVQAKLKGVATTEIFSPSTTESSNDDELLEAELDPTVSSVDLGTITYSPEEMFQAEYKPKINAEVCFPYTTKIASDNFWISGKQSDLDKGSLSSSDNSDAPVHATNLEEFKGTGKVRFQFLIESVGEGEVVETCFPEEDSDEIVEVNILQPIGVSCETLGGSYGDVKLINGRKKIECGVPTEGENYKTPLVMELNYYYNIDLEKTITIRNVG